MRALVLFALATLVGGCAPTRSTSTNDVAIPPAGSVSPARPNGAVAELRPLTVETRKKERSARPAAGRPVPPGGGTAFDTAAACEETITWPAVHGSASPETDERINRALRNEAWILDGEAFATCAVGHRVRASRGFEVVWNTKGIFAVRETESSQYEGSIHPWEPGKERWLAFDTRTGATLGAAEILDLEADGKRAKVAHLLERCVKQHVRDVNGDDPAARTDMLSRVNLDNPALLALPTPRGLRFGATGYAPPARVLEGQGPVLTWAALAREGVLRPDGLGVDVLALTRGASTPGDEPCARAE
ncbi:MAG: hypothetical protein U0183_13230 [Polyangiaceae bacterium]